MWARRGRQDLAGCEPSTLKPQARKADICSAHFRPAVIGIVELHAPLALRSLNLSGLAGRNPPEPEAFLAVMRR
jgi:hypothetical protein